MKFQQTNPYLGNRIYIPDGEPHVYENKIYVYGSHDIFNSLVYCAGDYNVYSCDLDFSEPWVNEGTSFTRKNVHNKTGRKCLWAPDVACKNGKYYLYFCYEWKNYIMVAISDSPKGPFKYYGLVHYKDGTIYGKGKNDKVCFDPAVLVDDDGKNYLYSGLSCPQSLKWMLFFKGITNADGTGNQVMELEDDMLTIKTEPKQLIPGYKNSKGTSFEGHEMFEASSIRKFNNKYYFIYSSVLSHELVYAMSDFPDHGFVYKGSLISNADIGYKGNTTPLNYYGNNHGSILNVNDKFYIFYHRQTNYHEQSRQACAEEIKMNDDGTFNMVEMTSQGINGKPLLGEGTYPSYIACNLMGKNGALKYKFGRSSPKKYKNNPAISERNVNGKLTQLIVNMSNESIVGFKYFNLKDVKEIQIKVRGSNGKITLSNELKDDAISETTINESKDFCTYSLKLNNYTNERCALYFSYIGNGKIDFLDFSFITDNK